MFTKKIIELLNLREFISVATADKQGKPNAAPKFLLKTEGNFLYLVDYTLGRTWENLKVNPRLSLSFMDTDTLVGYQINGAAEIIDKGREYDSISKELEIREIDLSARRIIEGVVKEKKHQGFELAIRSKFVILKVKIEEMVEIGPCGQLKREKICPPSKD